MSGNQKLLVVDDEVVICQACRRIFSRQGFQVEESTDAREGLSRATEQDYDGILLDIKMPHMDGIQFLEKLRETKPDVPVMIMTGYPSIPNAASAVRLGASDYITKPFTPEEITQAVQRMLAHHDMGGKYQAAAGSPDAELKALQAGEFLFFDQSWLQPEVDGSACVGAVPAHPQEATIGAVQLPKIGEVVYQGLPLAGVSIAGKPSIIMPSPISGVIVGVNELLSDDPTVLFDDPCGKGWIACICTTRLEEELNNCKPRRVILANADKASARDQRERLELLGCRVHVVKDWDELAPAVQNPDYRVLLFDEASFSGVGPVLVGRVGAAAPSMKVVVVASSASQWEAAYREHGIFYYAVAPFADNEIVDVLGAAFRAKGSPLPAGEHREASSELLSGIRITNRNGHKVHLLAGPGLLRRDDGLGGQIRQKLTDQAFPVVTTPGSADVTPNSVLKTANTCDRVMVLLAKDTGRLPGSLLRDTKAEYVSQSRENAGRVTTLVVQPDAAGGFAGLDDRTTEAMAGHIVQEMASY